MAGSLIRSALHNILVLVVGFGWAYVGTRIDSALGTSPLRVSWGGVAGALLLALGFLIRLWAAFHFYRHQMRVISLRPQSTLVTSGPFRFSRNPLYLGGNVFVFFGCSLLLKSASALVMTALHLPLVDLMIRREERQLEQAFGEEWGRYRNQVRRWI